MANKFNAKKVEYDGIKFDSRKECAHYIMLKDKEIRGIIKNLKTQVKYELLPRNERFKPTIYIADFVYEVDGVEVVEDVKGLRKGAAYSLFKIKQKLMYDKFKILVNEI
jgi:hypothetical protein